MHNTTSKSNSDYTIIPEEGGFSFEVINNLNKKKYFVNMIMPFCSCRAWYYTKRNKKGFKKKCKHILICRGIK